MKEKIKKYGWILVVFLHIMGLIFININSKYIYLTPYNLSITLLLIVFSYNKLSLAKTILLVLIGILGFLVECAGVNTGLIFGNYFYGDVLGFKLMNTPLLIAFNWIIVIVSAFHLTQLFVKNNYLKIVIASLLCTLLDVLIEPVAIKYQMWNWAGNSVPFQNYVAWFVCAFVFSILYSFSRNGNDKTNNTAAICFVVYVLFFSLI